MLPTQEELKATYAKYPDAEIVKMATGDVSGLRQEALDVLREEISNRKLDINVLKILEQQLTAMDMTDQKLAEYCKIVRKQPCPVCDSNIRPLNASMTRSCMSFIIIAHYQKDVHLACPNCLKKSTRNAIIKSLLLGWWGFPWGIIRTIQALIFNFRMLPKTEQEEPSDVLLGLTYGHAFAIEEHKDSKAAMRNLVKNMVKG